ncbi:Hypothetical_protein [Hexamita inflata]|uniref:Hypothetical_protein n=1 Tax=Hexamita inflata TaxID=28002 RepID=A0AA86TTP4_9EUKA|nr:Hypothetical protein HINF_LOCUS15735 [Hexamita inflata]
MGFDDHFEILKLWIDQKLDLYLQIPSQKVASNFSLMKRQEVEISCYFIAKLLLIQDDLSVQVISKLDELVYRKVASFELTNVVFDFHQRLIYQISWTKN